MKLFNSWENNNLFISRYKNMKKWKILQIISMCFFLSHTCFGAWVRAGVSVGVWEAGLAGTDGILSGSYGTEPEGAV